jgi:hypothetical protein
LAFAFGGAAIGKGVVAARLLCVHAGEVVMEM